MKKLWKVLAVLAVVWTAAAALAGWRLSRRVGRDACAVGIIFAADGPTSIIVEQNGGRAVVNAFFRLAFFFLNCFSSLSGIRIMRHKRQRTRRRAERP